MKKAIIPLCALVLGFAICFTAFADIIPFTPKTYKVRVGDKPVNYYRQTDSVTFGMRQEGTVAAGSTIEILYETTVDGVLYGEFNIVQYWDESDSGPKIIGSASVVVTDADTGESHTEVYKIYGTKDHSPQYRYIRLSDVQRLDDAGNVVTQEQTDASASVTAAETQALTAPAPSTTIPAGTAAQTESSAAPQTREAQTSTDAAQTEPQTETTDAAQTETTDAARTDAPTAAEPDTSGDAVPTEAVSGSRRMIGFCLAAAVCLTLAAAVLCLIRRKKAARDSD